VSDDGARREVDIRWRGNRMWHVRVGNEELVLHSEELGDLCKKAIRALMHLPGAPGERDANAPVAEPPAS
jgi:hypothetical protein